MQTYDVSKLTGPVDWSGPTLPAIAGAVVKLRWINSAFRWHRNHGAEVFCVMDGVVDMHIRSGPDAEARVVRLDAGQLILIEDGEEHVAHPVGEARILVIEEEECE